MIEATYRSHDKVSTEKLGKKKKKVVKDNLKLLKKNLTFREGLF